MQYIDIAATDGSGDYAYNILVQIPLNNAIHTFNNAIVAAIASHVATQLSIIVLPGDVFFQFFVQS